MRNCVTIQGSRSNPPSIGIRWALSGTVVANKSRVCQFLAPPGTLAKVGMKYSAVEFDAWLDAILLNWGFSLRRCVLVHCTAQNQDVYYLQVGWRPTYLKVPSGTYLGT